MRCDHLSDSVMATTLPVLPVTLIPTTQPLLSSLPCLANSIPAWKPQRVQAPCSDDHASRTSGGSSASTSTTTIWRKRFRTRRQMPAPAYHLRSIEMVENRIVEICIPRRMLLRDERKEKHDDDSLVSSLSGWSALHYEGDDEGEPSEMEEEEFAPINTQDGYGFEYQVRLSS